MAADFFTIEVWTAKGLQRFIVLFFIELSTRRVEVAGISAAPNGLWMSQIARNLTDSVDGLLLGKRYLIHDRDPLFTHEFLSTLKDAGIESVKLPPRSPNLNVHAERFVCSIKESCLERLILFGESFAADGYSKFRRPLSLRAQPPRLGEPTHSTGNGTPRKHGCGSAPGTSGWHAELLLPNSSINTAATIITTGSAVCVTPSYRRNQPHVFYGS